MQRKKKAAAAAVVRFYRTSSPSPKTREHQKYPLVAGIWWRGRGCGGGLCFDNGPPCRRESDSHVLAEHEIDVVVRCSWGPRWALPDGPWAAVAKKPHEGARMECWTRSSVVYLPTRPRSICPSKKPPLRQIMRLRGLIGCVGPRWRGRSTYTTLGYTGAWATLRSPTPTPTLPCSNSSYHTYS